MLDDERRLALLHCVLSHHGAAAAPGGRFGSVEALTLYRLNALDAGVKGAFEHGLGVETRRAVRRSLGSAAARHGPGGPSSLQNWQGRAAPGLEGSIPSPRRGWTGCPA